MCVGETINVNVNNGMGALIYIIQLSRGKENVAGGFTVSEDGFESQASVNQHRAYNWQMDSGSLRQMVREVLQQVATSQ